MGLFSVGTSQLLPGSAGAQGSWRGAVHQELSKRTRGHGYKSKEEEFRLEIRRKFDVQ